MSIRVTSIGAVTAEPVTQADARTQCRIVSSDTSFDTQLTRLIAAARDHVEKYCAMRFAERTITMRADSFVDLATLPEAPLKAVTSITYRDPAGNEQTLSDTVYELGGDRFSPAIVLKDGQQWPEGTAIGIAVVSGGGVPEGVAHAMLMLVAHWFAVREAVNVGNIVSQVPMAVEALLSNERRWG